MSRLVQYNPQPVQCMCISETDTQTELRIMQIQRRIGAVDDGFWGPQSIAACKRHLRKMMPYNNPWPKSDQASLAAFYGPAYSEAQLIKVHIPCHIKVKYVGREIGKPGCEDDTIYCHEKVAESLIRVLADIHKVKPDILTRYYGCWNPRKMRNGRLPSLHARGAATDWAADTNGNLTHWPLVADMPIEVMECFAREGWLAAGAFWGRDAMHFQATREG